MLRWETCVARVGEVRVVIPEGKGLFCMILLKWIYKKQVVNVWSGLSWFMIVLSDPVLNAVMFHQYRLLLRTPRFGLPESSAHRRRLHSPTPSTCPHHRNILHTSHTCLFAPIVTPMRARLVPRRRLMDLSTLRL